MTGATAIAAADAGGGGRFIKAGSAGEGVVEGDASNSDQNGLRDMVSMYPSSPMDPKSKRWPAYRRKSVKKNHESC